MQNRDLALKFVQCFCDGDIDGIKHLLAPDLRFRGPLLAFDSAAAYCDALQKDPPEQCNYRILSLTEGEEQVAVFYELNKDGHTLPIAQLFTIRDGLIAEILLIFDSSDFK